MIKYTYVSDKERVKVTSTFFYISAKFQVKVKYRGWVTKFNRYYKLGLMVNPTDEIIRAYRTASQKDGARVVSVPTMAGIPSPAP